MSPAPNYSMVRQTKRCERRDSVKQDPRKFATALITGISGSGGSYLAEHIVEEHPAVKVHGVSRWHRYDGASESNKNQPSSHCA